LISQSRGLGDVYKRQPVIVGKNGWEKIVDYKLNEEEMAAMNKSADAVRNMNSVLATLGL
jgi:malate dehydrogenase